MANKATSEKNKPARKKNFEIMNTIIRNRSDMSIITEISLEKTG